MSDNERIRKLKSSCVLGFLIWICVSASVILMNRNSFTTPYISLPYKKYVTSNTKTSKHVNVHISTPYEKCVASNGTQASKYVNGHILTPNEKCAALNTKTSKYVSRHISSQYDKYVALNSTETFKYVNEHILSPYKKYVASNSTQASTYVNGHILTQNEKCAALNTKTSKYVSRHISSQYDKYIALNSTKTFKCVNEHILSPYKKYVPSNGTKKFKYVNENQILKQPSLMKTANKSTEVLKFLWKKTTKGVKPGIICPIGTDRLGNQIFQFASAFGIAMAKNMSLVIDKKKMVNRIFNLKVHKMDSNYFCDKLELKREKFSGTFDSDLLNFNSSKNFRIGRHLESWKYFHNFTAELKKQLVFRQHIQIVVNRNITGILQNFNVKSRRNATLVGVHVRRGDKLRLKSFNVATPEYLRKSVAYFKNKYNDTIFIVASDDMTWTKANMPDKIKVAYIHGRPETDMATLASCDHVITTVGTFGWWCGWLACGEVTYFKWPTKPGSPFSKILTYEDFFYPGWIGM